MKNPALPARPPLRRAHLFIVIALVAVGLKTSAAPPNFAIVPPPEPKIPPTIADLSEHDRDRNKVDDAIDQSLGEARRIRAAANGAKAELDRAQAMEDEIVTVVVDFTERITQNDLDRFVQAGGTVTWIYKSVSYGWNGEIGRSRVPEVAGGLGPRLNGIVLAKRGVLHMHMATRMGRVRQQWPLGYNGAPNITIGVFDTGISPTHTDLAGRQQFWGDYTADGAVTPRDIGEHGSHVAGIALGAGTAAGANPATINYTDSAEFATDLSVGNLATIELPTPNGGVGAANFQWDANLIWTTPAAGRTVDLTLTAYEADNDGATTLNDAGLFGIVGANTATSPLALNSAAAWPAGIPVPYVQHYGAAQPGGWNVNSSLFQNFVSKAAGTWTGNNRYSARTTLTALNGHNFGVGDAFNFASGVAPECRWAGFKVFTDAGAGNAATFGAALDDLVNIADDHAIMVLNMSVGFEDGGVDAATRTRVNNVVNAGVFVAVSAGNEGPNTFVIGDPGRAALAMTVAASNHRNRLTRYTSFGFTTGNTVAGEDVIKPDIMAPGGSGWNGMILSVDSNDADAADTGFADSAANDYRVNAGTSMASPFVAGCAALVIDAWQQNGHTWTFGNSTDPLFVKMLLCATASESNVPREIDPVNDTASVNSPALGRATTPKDAAEGHGMINVDAAIECLRRPAFVKGPVPEALGANRFDKRASGFSVNLVSGVAKTFNLVVPAGADFDMYLYRATPNARGNPVILASSVVASTAGNTETITHTPAASGTHYLVVKRVSGAGTFTLSSPNIAPTLTAISTLAGATEDTAYTISHAALAANANEFDADGDPISFRVVLVSSGTLTKNGSPVVPGSTHLAAGENLVWTPAANANGSAVAAFTTRAFDGTAVSATAIQVNVAVAAVNDAPVAGTTAAALAYTENGAAIAIDTLLTLSDVDHTSLVGATVSITGNHEPATDILAFVNQLGITGSFNGPAGVMTLSGSTTVANYRTALRAVTFRSTSDNPSTTKTISFRANDGIALGAPATRNINITRVNDVPTLTTVNTLPGALTAEPFSISYATLAAAANEFDADGDVISFRVELVSTGTLTKNGTPVTAGTTRLFPGESFVWTSAVGASGSAINVFTTRAHDGTAASATAIQVRAAVNNRPTITDITDKTTPQDTPIVVNFTVGDVETPVGSLIVSSTSSNPSLVPDANIVNGGSGAGRNITITPVTDQFGTAIISVTVNDGSATKTDTFQLRVLAVNNFLWAKQNDAVDPEIGAGAMFPYSMVTDSAGNTYTAGYFAGLVQLGGASLQHSSGGYGLMFLVKMDANGNVVWARQAVDPADPEDVLTDSYANDVAVDSAGNVYITGSFEGWATTIGGVALTPGGNSYCAKFDSSGNALWVRQSQNPGWPPTSCDARQITVDSGGNVYWSGFLGGTKIFGSVTLNSAGAGNMFVLKLDSAGNSIWGLVGGSVGSIEGSTTDSAGNCYFSGFFATSCTFGSLPALTAPPGPFGNSANAYILKVNNSGTYAWAKQVVGDLQYGYDLVVDGSANTFIVGTFFGTATIGSTTLTTTDIERQHAFVAKFDGSGNAIWATQTGGATFEEGRDIALDSSGNVFITGFYGPHLGSATFGATTLSGQPDWGWNSFLAKLSPSGAFLLAKQPTLGGIFSFSSESGAVSIGTDSGGKAYVVGTFYNEATFGPTTLFQYERYGIYITRFGSE
jgi:subtilisin family serine protease